MFTIQTAPSSYSAGGGVYIFFSHHKSVILHSHFIVFKKCSWLLSTKENDKACERVTRSLTLCPDCLVLTSDTEAQSGECISPQHLH